MIVTITLTLNKVDLMPHSVATLELLDFIKRMGAKDFEVNFNDEVLLTGNFNSHHSEINCVSRCETITFVGRTVNDVSSP